MVDNHKPDTPTAFVEKPKVESVHRKRRWWEDLFRGPTAGRGSLEAKQRERFGRLKIFSRDSKTR